MRIKVLFDNKRGSSLFIEEYFDLVREFVERYPNAIWRRLKSKKGEIGYEIRV